jgi:hypothetical protein
VCVTRTYRGTVTLSTPDLYGGSAIVTGNIIRKSGLTSTSDVAGAGTFTANPGDTYTIMIGVNSTDDDAEPFGPIITYQVPCEETPTVEVTVVDDAAATSLTAIAFDPDDGNSIVWNDPVDIDTGNVKTIKTRWTGSFEEDFGNRWCEDDEGVKNVLVVRYNTSQYDNAYVTEMGGSRLPVANVQISRLLAASSGYTDATFWYPVIRSNADYEHKLVLDATDTATHAPDGGVSNVTLYLYDVGLYIDNDVTPSAWLCGIMDEDGNEVAATAADSLTIVIEDD